ncbi:MAG TPA: DUF2182 domain-containing protein [Nitrososphaerales archaeon]|nr:DUF2182 domain-containing protein [Nitrososphaerales archaeon]
MPAKFTDEVFVRDKLTIAISFSLLTLALVSWAATYYLMPIVMASQSGMMSFGVGAIVSSFSFTSISIFESVWIIGMVAMMFPAMLPIVLFYTKIASHEEPRPLIAKTIGTFFFLGGYLAIYSPLGIVSFACVWIAINFSESLSQVSLLSIIAPAGILLVAGVYQFTPIKSSCLSKCVSPIGFFALHFKTGLAGALRMGVQHGVYCVACCWAFMLVMLAVGAMSIPIMAVLAGVIALEKVLLKGAVWFNRLVGVSFLTLGIVVLAFPSVLTMV